jgi:hypothetical protein
MWTALEVSMAANSPTRIDEDLFAAAKTAGAALSRSAAQQVNHWARIGRQLEASGSLSQRDIARVLAGTHSYDRLDALAQAVVRAEWDERMTQVREKLDFTSKLAAGGLTWTEADETGQPVHRQPAGGDAPQRKRPAKKAAGPKPARSSKQPSRRRTPRSAA